jgi:hypothetical protein
MQKQEGCYTRLANGGKQTRTQMIDSESKPSRERLQRTRDIPKPENQNIFRVSHLRSPSAAAGMRGCWGALPSSYSM